MSVQQHCNFRSTNEGGQQHILVSAPPFLHADPGPPPYQHTMSSTDKTNSYCSRLLVMLLCGSIYPPPYQVGPLAHKARSCLSYKQGCSAENPSLNPRLSAFRPRPPYQVLQHCLYGWTHRPAWRMQAVPAVVLLLSLPCRVPVGSSSSRICSMSCHVCSCSCR
jgi:hypothetical protein